MQTKISILFLLKRTKSTTDGLTPIYLRVTIDGKRIEVSTKRYVEESKWLISAGKVKGTTEEARSINAYLDMLKSQVYDHQTELVQRGIYVNADNMKNKLLGVEEKNRSLIKIFEEHNKQMKSLIGKEFAEGTYKRYVTSLSHTKEFIKWKLNVSDIDIRTIDLAFLNDYEFYLRSVRNCNNNSAVKYLRNFGKIIHLCLANEWLEKNPLKNYKTSIKTVERTFLSEEEIQTMADKKFATERLNQVRDIFIFCCFTRLAYIDVKNLRKSQISVGIDGEKWIYTNRQKTGTLSNIPLLPMALAIVEKYKDHPQCINSDTVLPVLSNQKTNSYLKEIADVCVINKELTFHIARHTFATTVTLSNGVPIESVSKMLGHKDLKTTQHYAKILDRKVSGDMMLLRAKLTPQLTVVQEIKSTG
jgi:site-specific recombinase XerD